MASQWIYWVSDGGGDVKQENLSIIYVLLGWIKQQNNADLIIYGGDIYMQGTSQQYSEFLTQIGDPQTVAKMCHTAGNHDWYTLSHTEPPYPAGYEHFWKTHKSRQPIDTAKKAGARYEHFIDMNGWRLIFLDTGPVGQFKKGVVSWPMGDDSRSAWLEKALTSAPSPRANMVFAHHSRLSYGYHGDNATVDKIWKMLFDKQGNARAVCTMAGHDHNVSVYDPRDAALNVTSPEKGVQVIVNGAGGYGLSLYVNNYTDHYPEVYPGPKCYPNGPDYPCAKGYLGYCVTQIELIDSKNAQVTIYNFTDTPKVGIPPTPLLKTPLIYTLP